MLDKELLISFIEESEEVLSELETGVTDLFSVYSGYDSDAERMSKLSVYAHRLRGSAALYGFRQLSMLASLSERLLDSRPDLGHRHREQFLHLLSTIHNVLREGLNLLGVGEGDHQLGLMFTQVGGTAQLQKLVAELPNAFEMRAPVHLHPAHDEQAAKEAKAAKEKKEAATSGLEYELQHFVEENADVWEYFSPEVEEHLGYLREQKSKGKDADVTVMFRSAHTIKGSSYMVGLTPLGNFAHRMEDLFGLVRDGELEFTDPLLNIIEQALDAIEAMLTVAAGGSEKVEGRVQNLQDRMSRIVKGEQIETVIAETPVSTDDDDEDNQDEEGIAPTEPISQPINIPSPETINASIRVPAQQLENLMEQVGEMVAVRSRMQTTLDDLNELQETMYGSQLRFQRTVRDFEERYLNPDMVTTDTKGNSSEMAGQNLTQQFAELEFDTYNDLNILARSITELSADFSEVRRRLSNTVSNLRSEDESLGKLMRQLRQHVAQTSRVAFSQATARLRRWARERQELFEFIVDGEEVKMDSSTLQRLTEPLLHLLTNAVYHGIGTQEERAELGKTDKGVVWIQAVETQNYLEVTVADNGKGIDLQKVRVRALERGLRSAQELNRMSNDDIARLILLPGFSTTESVGSVAGRGVGMDVVATAIRQLGGELLISTELGIGTAFTMRLPTAQRIIDVLSVYVGNMQMAFSVNAVKSLQEVTETDLKKDEDRLITTFDGRDIQVIDLRHMWGHDTPSERASLVILGTITGEVAARVDEFGQIEESTVSPPNLMLGQMDYLAGTTVATNGNAIPILDPAGLTRLARRPVNWLSSESSDTHRTREVRLLLVDDSLSVRRLVGRMLERGGYQVQTANDGQEALEILQLDTNFEAVITDLEMPRMNGYELLSAVRSRPSTNTLPVVVMTTRAGEKHQQLAFQLGANDYFSKPVNEALLLRQLGQITGAGAQT